IEHVQNPTPLIQNIRKLLKHAPVALISTPERDRVRGFDHMGPPGNIHHIREWNLAELRQFLSDQGMPASFSGFTINNNHDRRKCTQLFVIEGSQKKIGKTPDRFRVVAMMTAYNEEDILVPSIEKLANDGIGVYLIDNWSTDRTYELAQKMLGHGVIGLE